MKKNIHGEILKWKNGEIMERGHGEKEIPPSFDVCIDSAAKQKAAYHSSSRESQSAADRSRATPSHKSLLSPIYN